MPPSPELSAIENDDTVHLQIDSVRRASVAWGHAPLPHRLDCVRRFRYQLIESADEFIAACSHLPHRCAGETLASEIIPLADAAKFLERNAKRILASTSLRQWGLQIITERRPLGVIFIVGPGNYPLFLPGVQVLHALVAGNGVILKPGCGGSRAALFLQKAFTSAGVPDHLFEVIPEAIKGVQQVIGAGVDKVIITGSQRTGRAIAALIATSRPTATVMELSGADAAIVLPGADIQRAADAVAFGLSFNAGNTCMVPRRILVDHSITESFVNALRRSVKQSPTIDLHTSTSSTISAMVDAAIRHGATVICGKWDTQSHLGPLVLSGVSMSEQTPGEDELGPVASLSTFRDVDELCSLYADCPMRLGASIFGPSEFAISVAEKIDAGCICINDLLAPTGHPAVTLSPRKASGYGATRGAAGLLEMTSPVSVIERTGRFVPHLTRTNVENEDQLKNLMLLKHAPGVGKKISAMLRIIKRR
ncbi:MAG: aldehyde dehydrogenase family protein [Phycisphaerae bacterium]